MDLRAVRYFVEVAREGNITQAATQLPISQSGLSRIIRSLEMELGVDLFVRRGPLLTLSKAGEAFLAESRSLLEQAERATQAARHSNAQPLCLRIGIVPEALHSLFMPWLSAFCSAHQDVTVHLTQGCSSALENQVTQGTLMGAVIYLPTQPGWNVLPLVTSSLHTITHASHWLAKRPMSGWEELRSEAVWLFAQEHGPYLHRRILHELQRARVTPTLLGVEDELATVVGRIATRGGVGFCTPGQARGLPSWLASRPLPTGYAELEMALVWNAFPNPTFEVFVDHMNQHRGQPHQEE